MTRVDETYLEEALALTESISSSARSQRGSQLTRIENLYCMRTEQKYYFVMR